MTKVSPAVSPTTTNPCDYFSFFSKEEDRVIEKHQKRELPPITNPAASCDFNLFFGFFFDGTRNNYNSCTRNEGYSNVARLYDTYPGQVVPDVISGDPSWQDYPHFFKVYVPGVHSDVCGGYLPKEQGRGSAPKGADKLSRIALGLMYRKARLAGVPLKAEKMRPAIQYPMEVDPETIRRFNAYLATLPQGCGCGLPGSTTWTGACRGYGWVGIDAVPHASDGRHRLPPCRSARPTV